MKRIRRLSVFVLSAASLALIHSAVFIHSAAGFPFNQEMVNEQKITGSIMRPGSPGSVALGTLDRQNHDREELMALKNPLMATPELIAKGRRLFEVNCTPCHGHFAARGQHVMSPLLLKGMPSINIADPAIAAKPDGHFFGYTFLGGIALMPAYGWKLSNEEIWQVTTYLRDVQARASAAASNPAQ